MQDINKQVINFQTKNYNYRLLNKKHLFTSKLLLSATILILVSFLTFGLAGCGKKAANKNAQKGNRSAPVQVEVMVAQTGLLLNTVSGTGSIIANEKAEIRPEISGRIIKILFEEGAMVQKNKLLLKMNDSDLQAQLKRNEAQGILLASDEFQKRKLLEIKAISQDEYDAAKSLLLVNQADKQLLEAQIAKTEIYAPFSGKVGLRSVSVGNFVASNTLIATIQQLDPIKIEFDVPEKYSRFIQPGLEVSFGIDASDSTFMAKVYAIESSITTETRSLTVRALCSNPSGLLKPGTFARINMILEKFPDAIKVPSEAVVTVLDGNSVFICKNGKATEVPVTTGIRTDSEIQITKGVSAGDSLIVTGLLQLTNGSPVMIKKKKTEGLAETVN
ncbi:MAG TPA: efflux transporter periplasmic adaptor subunit [Prolixibacteraceae bacterium]|nr:efflux transporter periplasmic adaptor subunit [Prolixibacteraceae bacterium]